MAPAYDDGGWDRLTVPGHWQLQGHGAPAYTNQAYPFPVDPPRVPDENPTGDHRRVFRVPADWAGRGAVLRFGGADSCLRAWLDGVELGVAFGSRLVHEFDVGALLRPGEEHVLAVRVHQWSSGSYLEDQDQWWLSGLFRDVDLLARPARGAVRDVFVHADADGRLRVDVDADAPARVAVPALGVDVAAGEEVVVRGARCWSAEQPVLYDAVVSTAGETVALRIGFRTVAALDGRLCVNGRPVTLRGVNRHDFDPDRGRAVGEDVLRADVALMKRAGLNAVRTSHYPPPPRLLELCDEAGLYVVCENDLETHGFQLCGWRENPVADPAWEAVLVDRMARTVERDKNHPSVVLWSLGNEAGRGGGIAAMARWARARDPSRLLHYEHDPTCEWVDVYSRMYADHAEVEAIGRRAEPALADAALDARRRGLPFVQCEYGHAMGNGPGGLADYQALFERFDRCAGGFVWEWIDHGLRSTTDDGRPCFAYGGDFGETLHDGNFVADGLLFPDRTPSPGLRELAAVVAPVRIGAARDGGLRIENRHDVLGLGHLRFEWVLEEEGEPAASGVLAVGDVAAGASVVVARPPLPPVAREAWLTVRAVTRDATPFVAAGHEVAFGQVEVAPAGGAAPDAAARPAAVGAPAAPAPLTLGTATFDAATGTLRRLGDLALDGPRLDVWRAPIDNDHGFFGPEQLVPRWRARGLDRMTHRVDAVGRDGDALVVRTRVAAAGTDLALRATLTWTAAPDGGLVLRLDVEPEGAWDVPLPRLGLRLAVPAACDRVTWFGLGPGEAYADSRAAVRVGRFSATVDALQTPYLMPQENGNRAAVRWATITDASGAGLRLTGRPRFDLTARRWTSEALDAARHPADLAPSDRVWINADLAQHGLGSAACGPAVLPPARLEVAPRTFAIGLGRAGEAHVGHP